MAIFFAAAVAACAGMAPTAQAADLTLKVSGAKSTQGVIQIALYRDTDPWLKGGPGVRTVAVKPGDAQPAVAVFKDLPAGRYAVSAFHDENESGRCETNLLGMPTERYGFSRDARRLMGPPSFGEAEITVSKDTAIEFTLK